MDAEARLRELGLTLPGPPKPMANYRAAVRAGNLLFVAGQGPTRDGKVTVAGKVGDRVSLKEAYDAARLAAINAVAVARAHLGSLAPILQAARATIYVASAPHFTDQPKVADGATDLLREIWGEDGLPARAAVGVPVLPMDIPVEVELVFEVRSA